MKLLSQQEKYQIYITPRYPSYGFGDNGAFRFKLNKSNIKRPVYYSSYNTELDCLDSLNELVYMSCDTSTIIESFFNNSLNDDAKFRVPRILILRGLECDTVMIDENHMVKIGNEIFMLSQKGIDFFYALMPLDIRLNWLIGRREMKTIDIQKLKSR